MSSFQAQSIASGSSSSNSHNSRNQRSTMGRKRSRLGLATTFASAALAISAASVSAFHQHHQTSATLPSASATVTSPLQLPFQTSTSSGTQLNVLADPEVYIKEQLDNLVVRPPRPPPLKGSKKDNRRKVPPRVTLKQTTKRRKGRPSLDNNNSKNTAKIKQVRPIVKTKRSVSTIPVAGATTAAAKNPSLSSTTTATSTPTSVTPATTSTTAAAATTTVAASTSKVYSGTTLNNTSGGTTSLPPRKQKNRHSRQKKTMPGFQGGAHTGRQQAFRDGIRLVENRTGKKLAKYVNTPEARKTRRQVNGEAMYKSSASVPDSLVQFAKDFHTIDRITPKEEIELGTLTQEAIRLQTLHEDLTDRFMRPPTDKEWCAAAGKINLEAISQAIDDGLEAKNKLVTSNLRMVQGVVNLYIRNGLGTQYNAGDLMQEGIMALIRAAEKFDPTRGFRFSTYAMYWIRSSVKRSQIIQSRIITVPQRLYENHKRIIRTEKEMRELLGRPPSKKELGDAVGMSQMQLERCVTAMNQRCFSLDQGITNTKKPMNADRSSDTLIDIVESRTDDGEYIQQKRIFLRDDLIETLHRHLSPEEVDLLLLRYGLRDDLPPQYGQGPLTIAAVSQIVKLKPDKVRRMLNKSLKHLQAIIGDEWNDFDREFR